MTFQVTIKQNTLLSFVVVMFLLELKVHSNAVY